MDERLIAPYIESTKTMLHMMGGVEVTEVGEPTLDEADYESMGVASVISFAGKVKGRFVIDVEPKLAIHMMSHLAGEQFDSVKNHLLLAGMAELNNIIAGDANTTLNNEHGLSLRLAPPAVFTGSHMVLATAKIDAVTIACKTAFGELKLNIGYQGGLEV